jgi:hypothetical protein
MSSKSRTRVSAIVGLLVVLAAGIVRPELRAQETSRVALVLQHGDGSVITRCVEFTESEISGLDILNRAGLSVVADFSSGSGARVCKIDGEGCPASDCWCECAGSPCVYWVYHHLVGGAWVYSDVGASAHKVRDGDVEGWAWGEGSPQGGVQPPAIPFDQICAPPPTNTPVPPADTPVPPTPVVWFRLDANPVPAGECTMVRWDTSGASAVYLDDAQVEPSGGLQACPAASQEYRLRVVSDAGEQTHTLILGVSGTAVPSATPTVAVTPSAAPSATATPAPSAIPTRTVRPTSTAGGEATPSPTPSSTPTAPPLPSATPTAREVAALVPTDSGVTPDPSPTPTETASPSPAAEQTGSGTGAVTGYALFGTVAAGLVGLVVFLARRR